MASSTGSEFLTFMRRSTGRNFTTRQSFVAKPQSVRSFSVSAYRQASNDKLGSNNSTVKTDAYPDGEHATNKGDRLDVQSNNAAKGKEARAQDTGGNAPREKDTRNSTEKAKKDHPEAPDVVIGMQDERGGKGLD